jgi:hypothetical protein
MVGAVDSEQSIFRITLMRLLLACLGIIYALEASYHTRFDAQPRSVEEAISEQMLEWIGTSKRAETVDHTD